MDKRYSKSKIAKELSKQPCIRLLSSVHLPVPNGVWSTMYFFEPVPKMNFVQFKSHFALYPQGTSHQLMLAQFYVTILRLVVLSLFQEPLNTFGFTIISPWCDGADNWNTSSRKTMMTSSNVNIFRVTGYLCGEFTGPRWIPCTKASDAELWCFLRSAPE